MNWIGSPEGEVYSDWGHPPDPFNAANLEANAGLAATLWHQFCELTKVHEGNPPLDWWGFKWAAYAMAGLEALPREKPSIESLAKVIYERAFDCRWEETHGIERDLWLEVARAVAGIKREER